MKAFQFHPDSKTLRSACKHIIISKGEEVTEKRIQGIIYNHAPMRIYNVAKTRGFKMPAIKYVSQEDLI